MNDNGFKWIRMESRLGVYVRDKFTCLSCGRDMRGEPSDQLTLDHMTPRVEGGGNEVANLFLSCVSCNSSRADRPLPPETRARVAERTRLRFEPFRKWAAAVLAETPSWKDALARAMDLVRK